MNMLTDNISVIDTGAVDIELKNEQNKNRHIYSEENLDNNTENDKNRSVSCILCISEIIIGLILVCMMFLRFRYSIKPNILMVFNILLKILFGIFFILENTNVKRFVLKGISIYNLVLFGLVLFDGGILITLCYLDYYSI
ncbi:hypothetical protein CWI37_0787p0010 [Hamiltosporidium tvaerminnensis]|uniref:Uncharacterized protein n=1 Tax=Hamiltosporidium tvaerminnensis TaxID=1176355 RepID=A0A4Q9KXY6_9MICR|nr:hypothetical protein CWI37_1480p0010 [Hamiltosporidium tvaerminnensis]TBU01169.1 hypothetical protein CWI37_0787p0010 [Hamiltosporidium tvaerminnensis]